MHGTRCNYRTDSNGDLVEPDSSCTTGGDVMICFFCILFGGLNLAQAMPGIIAVGAACREVG